MLWTKRAGIMVTTVKSYILFNYEANYLRRLFFMLTLVFKFLNSSKSRFLLSSKVLSSSGSLLLFSVIVCCSSQQITFFLNLNYDLLGFDTVVFGFPSIDQLLSVIPVVNARQIGIHYPQFAKKYVKRMFAIVPY